VVELITLDDAQIKYSTVQNWYAGDEQGRGGIYNFVTKRGHCRGARSKISWTQVEVGSAITWKYPSVMLEGDALGGRVLLCGLHQQQDAGRHRHQDDPCRTRTPAAPSCPRASRRPVGQYLPRPGPDPAHGRERAQPHLLRLHADRQQVQRQHLPGHRVEAATAITEHEATTSKISEDQLFYIQSRGISEEDATSLIVNGFCKDVFKELPLEFSVEAIKLLELKLEHSVG
jgi:Fe-S cluster assembly protein SufB